LTYADLYCIIADILRNRNEIDLMTPEELTELKLDISLLKDAASVFHMCELNRRKLLSIKG